jgi:predicted nucleic acid-binding protein
VLVTALIDGGPAGKACADRLAGEDLAAPELVLIEAVGAVRGLLRGGKVDPADADRAIRLLPALPLQRFPHHTLLPRVWELRENVTAYDAAYLALAETLDAPLVTGDARLRRVPGARCAVEIIG